MQARDAALTLIDRGTGKARRSIRLDLNEESIAVFIAVEFDPCIEPTAGRETPHLANCGDLNVRSAFELSAKRVQDHVIHSFR